MVGPWPYQSPSRGYPPEMAIVIAIPNKLLKLMKVHTSLQCIIKSFTMRKSTYVTDVKIFLHSQWIKFIIIAIVSSCDQNKIFKRPCEVTGCVPRCKSEFESCSLFRTRPKPESEIKSQPKLELESDKLRQIYMCIE